MRTWGRAPAARSRACVMLGLSLLLACGGESTRYASPGTPDTSGGRGGTGSVVPNAGAAGRGAAPPGAAGSAFIGPLAESGPACDAMSELWAGYVRELDANQPLQSPCIECVLRENHDCGYAEALGSCPFVDTCMGRRCLCHVGDPEKSSACAAPSTDDLCFCVWQCTPEGRTDCEQAWVNYFECVTDVCGDTCR